MKKKIFLVISAALGLLYGLNTIIQWIPFQLQSLDLFSPSCEFVAKTKGNIGLSIGRTAVYSKGGQSEDALAISTIEHDSGKYYFEMEYVCKGCTRSHPAKLDAGIYWTASKSLHRPAELLVAHDDWFYGIKFLEGRPRTFKDGDVAGIAVDFDRGRIFFSHNGVWQVCNDLRTRKITAGDPNDINGGLEIKVDRSYAAAVFIELREFHMRRLGWNANFSQEEFKFSIPQGFSSWDESNSPSNSSVRSENNGQRTVSWIAATPHGVNVSDDGEIFRHNGDKDAWYPKAGKEYLPGRAVASKYHTKGKWYLEVTYLDGDPSIPKSKRTALGYQSNLASYFILSDNAPGWAGQKGCFYLGLPEDKLQDGKVIGIALDLDRSRYFISIDGKWTGRGIPSELKDGRNLREAENYAVVAEVAYAESSKKSDGWSANFGQQPFLYDIPEGFLPYAQ
jgi:hypothetical protein